MRAVLAAGYDADETLIARAVLARPRQRRRRRDLGAARRPRQRQARGPRRRGGGAGRRADRRGRGAPRAGGGAERARRRPALLRRVRAPVQPQPRPDRRRHLALVGAHRRDAADPARLRPRPRAGRCAAPRRRARRRRGADRRRDVRRVPRATPTTTPEATPLADVVGAAHAELHGARPAFGVFTGTTDARYVTGPCYCYGPLAGNLHGIDEWVDLASCRSVAETIALVLARRLG